MKVWPVFYTIADNVGVSFESLIILLLFIGGIIFYARDFKVGLLLHWFAFGLSFLWFYFQGLNWTIALVLFFMFLVLIALSFYSMAKTTERGAIV